MPRGLISERGVSGKLDKSSFTLARYITSRAELKCPAGRVGRCQIWRKGSPLWVGPSGSTILGHSWVLWSQQQIFVARWQMTRLSWEISGMIEASGPTATKGFRVLLQGCSAMGGRSRLLRVSVLYPSVNSGYVLSMVNASLGIRWVVAGNLGLWGCITWRWGQSWIFGATGVQRGEG